MPGPERGPQRCSTVLHSGVMQSHSHRKATRGGRRGGKGEDPSLDKGVKERDGEERAGPILAWVSISEGESQLEAQTGESLSPKGGWVTSHRVTALN